MAVNLWSDESKTFEDVNDEPLTPDEIVDMREQWRRATPEQRVQLMALAEGMLARQNGEQPHQARARGATIFLPRASRGRRGCR